MAYSVAQNTTFLTVASVLQKIVSFVYFIFIARLIGVADTGQYFFAISFTTIFSVFADFGLAPVLTREAAKSPDRAEEYVNTVFWSKVFLGVFAVALVFVVAQALNYSWELRQLIIISAITMFFDNLNTSFFSIFRAKKNLVYEAISIVLSQIITLIIGTAALLSHLPLYWLIIAYAVPSAFTFLYASYFLQRTYAIHYRFELRWSVAKMFFGFAIPFAFAGIISRVYSYADSVLISKYFGAEYLGWWSVPYKITFAFQFIATALSASVYPAMSAVYLRDKNEVARLFEKAWHYLFIVVFPLSFGLMAIAKPAITGLYGLNYAPSVPVLQILLISLIFGFLSFITGALLNATNRQHLQTTLLFIALAVNVPLNLLLLPKYGLVGAAVAALAGNMVLGIGGYVFGSRAVPLSLARNLNNAWSVLWPAAIMAASAYYIAEKAHWIVAVIVGAAIYGGLLLYTGKISADVFKTVWSKVTAKNI